MTLQTHLGGWGTQRKRQPGGQEGDYGGRDGGHTQLRIGAQTRMKALALNHCSPRASAHLREGGGQGLEKHTTQEGGAQQGHGTHTLRAGGLAGTAQGPSGPALNGSRCPRQPPDRPQTHPDLTSISVGQALGSPCPPGATLGLASGRWHLSLPWKHLSVVPHYRALFPIERAGLEGQPQIPRPRVPLGDTGPRNEPGPDLPSALGVQRRPWSS